MRILVRTLLILTLVLTVLVGAILTVTIRALQDSGKLTIVQAESLVSDTTNVAGWWLSRLNILPLFHHTEPLIAVVVENHQGARPFQEGLDKALLVEEFFVEGYISRFVAFFSLDNLPPEVGPVRSLRPYFIDGMLPLATTIFHAGGSPEALERAYDSDEIVAFNGLVFDRYFVRNDDIPAPHNLFLPRDDIKGLLAATGDVAPTPWPPYTVGRPKMATGATMITIDFYNPDHDVTYTYNWWRQDYTRRNGDELSALAPENVLLLEIPVQGVGEYGRLDIDVSGEGSALLFRSGHVYEGSWSKSSGDSNFVFTDSQGDPFVFAGGSTWMTVVDMLDRVEWSEEEIEVE